MGFHKKRFRVRDHLRDITRRHGFGTLKTPTRANFRAMESPTATFQLARIAVNKHAGWRA
eukprot:1557645-Prymnesium_polylepis.1